MDHSFARRALIGGLGALLLLLIVLPACSDDPILGPSDGSSDSGDGSYSNINRLAPSPTAVDSGTSASSSTRDSADINPERF